jgi:hypothetical protein
MRSTAKTVAEYLKELPADRRAAIEAVRQVVRANIDGNVEEGMQYGAISYYVPHRIFPAGYHCDPAQPLPYIGIASQKQYMALYLHGCYISGSSEEEWIRRAYAKAGRPLDMGKSCLRFKSLETLDLDIVAEAIRRVPSATYVERYLTALGPRASKSKPATAKTSGRTAVEKSAKKVVRKVMKKVVKKAVKKAAQKATKPPAKKK